MPSLLSPLLLLLLLSPSPPTATAARLNRFLGAGPGSQVPGMSDLKRYLSRFGYLPPSSNFSDAFDADLIARYQAAHGLHVTRRIDAETLSLLSTPRCGVGDGVNGTNVGVRHFAFFPGQPRWVKPAPMALTYALSPTDTIDYIPREVLRAVLRRAFARWARVIPISFSEARGYDEADVKVAFYGGDHGDGEAFDGVLGVLAHAFSPESGRLHLDAAERWAVDFGEESSEVAVDLESVATHEIGHVLGLAHSSERDSVMYPSLSPRTTKADLRVDDVQGAQKLYGSNPHFRFSSLLESDTSSGSKIRVRVRVRICIEMLIVVGLTVLLSI